MRTWIAHLIDRLRSSYWLIPSALMVGAIVAAVVLVQIDDLYGPPLLELVPSLRKVSPDGTQRLLGTVATSVLTLAGVTFSATIVALTLASSQFGPRLLRNFIRSRANQATLGTLLATHAYCLIVLRSVRLGEYAFVPHGATLGAFLLTLISLGVFTYFIHDVVTSIQAERVIAEVYDELSGSIDRFFRDPSDSEGDDQDLSPAKQGERNARELREDEVPVNTVTPGYVEAINVERLVEKAAEGNFSCRLLVKPGDFVVTGTPLLALTGSDPLADETEETFCQYFFLGSQRTAEQDFEYGIRQLVEIALRALSPGVNDPFTAMNCIDHLGAVLAKVTQKEMPQTLSRDSEDIVRVSSLPESFAGFVGAACDQIRQASGDKPDVSIRLLEMLGAVGRQCRSLDQWKPILRQAEMTASVAVSRCSTQHDVDAIRERLETILEIGGVLAEGPLSIRQETSSS